MHFSERDFPKEFTLKIPIKIRWKIRSLCTYITQTSIFAPQGLLFGNEYGYNTPNQYFSIQHKQDS
jgi:hypothetical protein